MILSRLAPDPLCRACYALAATVVLFAVNEALVRRVRLALAAQLWLLSDDGGDLMEAVGVDAGAARARLVNEWSQAGLRRLVSRG
jgi:hypothetical protein